MAHQAKALEIQQCKPDNMASVTRAHVKLEEVGAGEIAQVRALATLLEDLGLTFRRHYSHKAYVYTCRQIPINTRYKYINLLKYEK